MLYCRIHAVSSIKLDAPQVQGTIFHGEKDPCADWCRAGTSRTRLLRRSLAIALIAHGERPGDHQSLFDLQDSNAFLAEMHKDDLENLRLQGQPSKHQRSAVSKIASCMFFRVLVLVLSCSTSMPHMKFPYGPDRLLNLNRSQCASHALRRILLRRIVSVSNGKPLYILQPAPKRSRMLASSSTSRMSSVGIMRKPMRIGARGKQTLIGPEALTQRMASLLWRSSRMINY